MPLIELECTGEVAAATDEADTYTPPAGKDVRISTFDAHATYSQNSVVMLVWDYGGAGEQILWSTKGDSMVDLRKKIPAADVDGVKKIALVCSNGDAGPAVFSSRCLVKVRS